MADAFTQYHNMLSSRQTRHLDQQRRSLPRHPIRRRYPHHARNVEQILERQHHGHLHHDLHLRASPAQILGPAPPLHRQRHLHPDGNREHRHLCQQAGAQGLAQAATARHGIPIVEDGHEHDDARVAAHVEGGWREDLGGFAGVLGDESRRESGGEQEVGRD